MSGKPEAGAQANAGTERRPQCVSFSTPTKERCGLDAEPGAIYCELHGLELLGGSEMKPLQKRKEMGSPEAVQQKVWQLEQQLLQLVASTKKREARAPVDLKREGVRARLPEIMEPVEVKSTSSREAIRRLPQPTPFLGWEDTRDVVEWLTEVDEYFATTGVPIEERGLIMQPYLRGQARQIYARFSNEVKREYTTARVELACEFTSAERAARPSFRLMEETCKPGEGVERYVQRMCALNDSCAGEFRIATFIRLVQKNILDDSTRALFVNEFDIALTRLIAIAVPQTEAERMELHKEALRQAATRTDEKGSYMGGVHVRAVTMGDSYRRHQSRGRGAEDMNKKDESAAGKGPRCFRCKRRGHFKRDCPGVRSGTAADADAAARRRKPYSRLNAGEDAISRLTEQVAKLVEVVTAKHPAERVSSRKIHWHIAKASLKPAEMFMVPARVETRDGKSMDIEAQVDTGSTHVVLSQTVVEEMGLPIHPANIRIDCAADSHQIKSRGIVHIPRLVLNDRLTLTQVQAVVGDGLHTDIRMLLGMDALADFDIHMGPPRLVHRATGTLVNAKLVKASHTAAFVATTTEAVVVEPGIAQVPLELATWTNADVVEVTVGSLPDKVTGFQGSNADSCMLKARKGVVRVPVWNRSSAPITIPAGGVEATVSPLTVTQESERATIQVRDIASHQTEDKLTGCEGAAATSPSGASGAVFPTELLHYLTSEETQHLGDRIRRYDQDKLATLREKIREKISEECVDREEREELEAVHLAHADIYLPPTEEMSFVRNAEMRIDLTNDTPIRVPQQIFSPLEKKFLEEKCRQLEKAGQIARSSSAYASRLCLVPKKLPPGLHKRSDAAQWPTGWSIVDGFRMTTDLRQLNSRTKGFAYPMPDIQERIERLHGSDRATVTDVADAFFTVPLRSSDAHKTAFRTHHGLWEWRVAPQGAKNSANVWACVIDDALQDVPAEQMTYYQDDLVAHGDGREHHVAATRAMFAALRRVGLRLKLDKTRIGARTIRFGGAVIDLPKRVKSMDDRKVEAVRLWRRPSTVTELRSFLGFVNFYRAFVADFGGLAAPLYGMTKGAKKTKLQWSDETVRAFESLKEAMTSSPVLCQPDFTRPFGIKVDRSQTGRGMGAVLFQYDDEGRERPVEYWSKKTSQAERNLSSTVGELKALYEACKHFRRYFLNGMRNVIITDHRALVHLHTAPDPTGKLHRYTEYICMFEFDIKHRDGDKLTDADALSRLWRVDEVEDESGRTKQELETGVTIRAMLIEDPEDVEVVNEYDFLVGQTFDHPVYAATTCVVMEATNDKGANIAVVRCEDQNGVRRVEHFPAAEVSVLVKAENIAKKADMQLPLSTEEWRSRQEGDESVQSWLGHPDFVTKEGLVWKAGQGADRLRLVVPESLQRNIMALYHECIGHPGMRRMYHTLKTKYYWSGMKRDVENFAKSCLRCKLRKTPPTPAPHIQPFQLCSRPFERLHVDLIGPLPKTTMGNQYILVAVDALTKWPELFALQNKSAQEVAECLVDEVYCRHGAPKMLVTDKGTEFTNELLQAIAKTLDFKHVSTTPYHPSADGQVERINREVSTILSFHVNKFHSNWDEFLAVVAMAIRTTVDSTRGFTPFFMLYGREARLPPEAHLVNVTSHKNIQEYVQDLVETVRHGWEVAAVNMSARDSKYNQPKARRVWKFEEYQEGDWAYIIKPFKSSIELPVEGTTRQAAIETRKLTQKFQPRWAGPYQIIRKYSPVVYGLNIRGRERRWHASNMKKE